ncbi:PH domain-containing protein [Shewanella intestini]|uniref:PH domain-containing protein n=1 Tax=Shewanella intestini TaxID=2017544 RepID=A0ABS5HXG0_9GAMM|nr:MULTISPECIES: PH domain-containing protein [Shewanella]MBR9726429.1 PH domain-containing protein [Shewanella intestini]
MSVQRIAPSSLIATENITATNTLTQVSCQHGEQQSQQQWTDFSELKLTPIDTNYPKSVLALSAAISSVIYLLALVILFIATTTPITIAVIIALALAVLMIVIINMLIAKARSYEYGVFEREFIMREGLFWHTTTALPYTRLQHANIAQDPVQRKFNLVTLKCYSAGSGTAEIDLPGLNNVVAEHLRQHILHCASAQAPKNTTKFITQSTSSELATPTTLTTQHPNSSLLNATCKQTPVKCSSTNPAVDCTLDENTFNKATFEQDSSTNMSHHSNGPSV